MEITVYLTPEDLQRKFRVRTREGNLTSNVPWRDQSHVHFKPEVQEIFLRLSEMSKTLPRRVKINVHFEDEEGVGVGFTRSYLEGRVFPPSTTSA